MFYRFKKLSKLNLKSFHRTHYITDIFTGKQIQFKYISPETKAPIAFAQFVVTTGQIGILDINEEFQRRGLGKQIIKEIEDVLKLHNKKEIWVACTKNHYYWSNLLGFQFRDSIHPSVNNTGYFKILE
jgi:GNAT superfamily N-acetyltransferase